MATLINKLWNIKSKKLLCLFFGIFLFSVSETITAKICDKEEVANTIDEILTSSSSSVKIKCSLTLPANKVITKRLIFEGSDASGVTFDCNGTTLGTGREGSQNYNKDMIEVKSEKTGATWTRPENVTIKNCNINGSVRVWGMGQNGEAGDIKESSRRSSRREGTNSRHVLRVRNNAPRKIVFDNITITGLARNPFYLAPGVTYTKLINSEIKGKSNKVGIYLDAESAYNTIKNNVIHVETSEDHLGNLPFATNRGWPQVAIDGSSHNKIINNKFSALNNGGIYLYRNCGEGGTIRHTPPEHNTIINNSFYYKNYKGNKPAIYLGSRDYGFLERLGHCDDDDGRPYGSSQSEKDYARHNIIMQNQLYKRKIWILNGGNRELRPATVEDMIVTKNKSVNSPNYIKYNEIVSERINRKAGCYLKNRGKDFLLHGESIEVCCPHEKITCNNGELPSLPPSVPPPSPRCSDRQKCCGSVNPDGTCNGQCWPRNSPCP